MAKPCSICVKPMAPSEAHRGGSGCAHAFCRACLAGHVRAKVDAVGAAAATVRCPCCAGALDPELCRAALPGDLFVRWCDLLLVEAARVAKWKRCPRCRIYVDKSHGCLHITCRCGFQFCYGCEKPWQLEHDGCRGE